MTAIKTEGLTKLYGDLRAVDGLTLSVEEGELFGLLGVNGAGKTTTVKLLSTLILPNGGCAEIMGHDLVRARTEVKSLINLSPQETAIAPNLTVYETLRFMAGIYGIRNAKEKIDALIEQFSLVEVLSKKGRTLSGGWQRKLSIALSLINDPKVLFLDEPTLGLDVLARRELWRVIKGLCGRVTIVLTTHYMEEAETLCDRVGIMHRGKLTALDTPAALTVRAGTKNFEDAFAFFATGGKV